MPITRVFEGTVDYLQILDKDGMLDKTLEPALSNEILDRMFRYMVYARLWDRKCIALQRTGRMYTYAPVEGQEAIPVGSAMAASNDDWIFPTYREANAVYHIRGIPTDLVNLSWMGLEDGLKLDKKYRCFPYVLPIATQLTHAVGASYANRLRKENPVTLAFCGDGATSEGDFHDALNFAGVLELPCVFIISNNQYAISVPRKWQTKSETLAQKALAYGMKGVQVDGNDVLAVYTAVKEAADNARAGKGPSVIEFVTYRMGPHTTSDDPKKYRDPEETAYWLDRDPIKRFRAYLKDKGIWSEGYEKGVMEESSADIEEAIKKSEAHFQDPKDMFRYVYADMTKELEVQSKEAFRVKKTQSGGVGLPGQKRTEAG